MQHKSLYSIYPVNYSYGNKHKRTQIYYGGMTSNLKNVPIVITETESVTLQNDIHS